MSENLDIYTIIFLVIAVIIFLRLRSVLGRRTGNERQPYDPYSASEANSNSQSRAGQDNIVHLPRNDEDGERAGQRQDTEDMLERLKGFAPEGSALHQKLTEILKADLSFDPVQFIKGAKMAYEIIVMAFADGNQKTLQPLLSRDVFDGFVSAIKDRQDRGETVDSSFVGIDKATIIDAELKNKVTSITMKFVSELITAVRNKNGEVIDGDPMKVREVTDIWTFSHEISNRDPNWKLVATETAN